MRNRSKLLVASLSTALLMSVAVGTASAGRISLSNARFRMVWAPVILNFGDVRCNLTLEGSFHSSTLQKRAEALIGYISRAIIAPPAQCTNGEITLAQETLPWHIRYRGYVGRLPRPAGVVMGFTNVSLRAHVNSLGATCEITTTSEKPFVGTAEADEEGGVTGFRADENSRIPLLGLCGIFGVEGSFSGGARLTLLNATTRITVRLI